MKHDPKEDYDKYCPAHAVRPGDIVGRLRMLVISVSDKQKEGYFITTIKFLDQNRVIQRKYFANETLPRWRE